MKKENTALYIGRFQPFHLGHLDALGQIFASSQVSNLVIAIGSSQKSYQADNPLTAGERFALIAEILEKHYPHKKVQIVPIADINDYVLWPHYICELLPPFSQLFTGSSLVKKLFLEQKPEIKIIDLKKNKKIKATIVRQNILLNKDISQLIPEETNAFLQKIDIKSRLFLSS